ncbi:hypothetical protein ANCCAN_23963, partial [Ancylostoma caninum]
MYATSGACSCLSRPDYMYESACDLKVGTYTGIHYATQEMSLLEVLDMMIDNSISGVPIVEESTMKVREFLNFCIYRLE